MADEELLEALDNLIEAIKQNTTRNDLLLQRAQDIKRERAKGTAWREIVSEERRPLIVELLTQNLEALSTAGGQLRRMEAQALHKEGLTMDRIAELFGVSRQRISELLRHGNGTGNGRRRGRGSSEPPGDA
jgi:hypothetical protein